MEADMPVYFFSDAHLGSDNQACEEKKVANVLRFLDVVAADGVKLYILGDLFDFWFEYKHAIPKLHARVIFRLASLVQAGIPIHYITGNHDFWLGDFLSKEIGISLHKDHMEAVEDGLRMFLIHGDGLSPADWKYRVFVRFPLRNRLAIRLYRLLPVDWAIPLAKAVSSHSRSRTAGREPKFLNDYEDFARKKLAEGYNAVVIGHIHYPAYRQFDNGIYLNTGDFFEHFSYGKLTDGRLSLEYLT